MEKESLVYRIGEFNGPLDLLLSLIDKNKVDIMDIPIVLICDQYMQYLEDAKKMDLELACEFIVMASDLLLIKSRMLLPRPENDESDPRKELIDALLLYQQAKEHAKDLRPMFEEYSGRMAKDMDEIPPEKGFPLGVDPTLLSKALRLMLTRIKETEEKAPSKLIKPLVATRVVNVEEKMVEILHDLRTHEDRSLFALLANSIDKADLIAKFMGILELIKTERILLCTVDEEEDVTLSVKLCINLNYQHDETHDEVKSEFDQGGDLNHA